SFCWYRSAMTEMKMSWPGSEVVQWSRLLMPGRAEHGLKVCVRNAGNILMTPTWGLILVDQQGSDPLGEITKHIALYGCHQFIAEGIGQRAVAVAFQHFPSQPGRKWATCRQPLAVGSQPIVFIGIFQYGRYRIFHPGLARQRLQMIKQRAYLG